MSIILILSLALAGIGGGAFLWIKGLYKKNKSQKILISAKENEIHSLRDTIRDMAILEGEKNIVTEKGKSIKKNNSEKSDTELSIDYANKLHNVPARKRARKK